MGALNLEAIRQFITLAGPEPDQTQQAMEAYAAESSFPIIGSAGGGVLMTLAELTDASRVFEFGSGFGYSASWFARGMAAGGEIVLVEVDSDELELARESLDEADYRPDFRFEEGDAAAVIERYDGPFEVVLIDHEKAKYTDGFERVQEKIPPGGAVVADNMMRGPMAFEDILAGLEGDRPADESAAGVVEYLQRLRSDDRFTTIVLPVGSGLAVSVRRR